MRRDKTKWKFSNTTYAVFDLRGKKVEVHYEYPNSGFATFASVMHSSMCETFYRCSKTRETK